VVEEDAHLRLRDALQLADRVGDGLFGFLRDAFLVEVGTQAAATQEGAHA
jgi:hypothetical protein